MSRGLHELALDPLDFIGRLAALVPCRWGSAILAFTRTETVLDRSKRA